MPMTPKQIRTKPFLTERKGYCKEEVEAFLEQVADELEVLQQRLATETPAQLAITAGSQPSEEVEQLQAELRRLRQERDELAQRASAPAPDWTAAVGAEVANVLRATHGAAEIMRQRAEQRAATLTADAEEMRAAAVAAAARLRTEAEMHAAEVVAEAWRQGAQVVTQQMDRFDELLTAERADHGPRQLLPASQHS